jgi:hypothetical protein
VSENENAASGRPKEQRAVPVPRRFGDAYRRRKAVRAYLEALSAEVLERQSHLEQLERGVLGERGNVYETIVSDVTERTTLALEHLDRRIDTLATRIDENLRTMDARLAELEERVARLNSSPGPAPPEGGRAVARTPRRPSRRQPPAAVAE